ncbi:MAG: alpha/beta hydrolase family esterase [Thermoanaerobaculia bacterium]
MKNLTISLAVLLLATTAFARGATITKESIVSGGKTRTFYLFVPERPAGSPPAPLLVTLHGSGRNGKILLDHWQKLAEKEGIVLAGPDSIDTKQWSYPVDGPDFLRDVIDAVKRKTPIDPRRVYLFGHSAGAGFALEMSLIESTYFAATAIHAGALPLLDFPVIQTASRKIPISIQVGTEDPYFPLADVRRTRDELVKNGFPVVMREIKFHDHDYYRLSRDINDEAWGFLKKYALDSDPTYVAYATN